MMTRRLKALMMAFAVAVLSGCSMVTTQLGTGRYEIFPVSSVFVDKDLTYRIDDTSWYRAPNQMNINHQRFVQRTSPSTSFEVLAKWSLIAETRLKRRFVDLMPREQAEYWLSMKISELAVQGGILSDSNIELQDWAGRPGFRYTANFTTVQDLDMKLVAYGASYDRTMYLMTYEGDVVESFDKALPSFEAIAETASISQK